jgi:transposase
VHAPSHTAYLLKESFGQLWSYEREGWARRFFENWRASLKWQRLKPYEKFAAMIDRHWDGIAAYCRPDNKVSNCRRRDRLPAVCMIGWNLRAAFPRYLRRGLAAGMCQLDGDAHVGPAPDALQRPGDRGFRRLVPESHIGIGNTCLGQNGGRLDALLLPALGCSADGMTEKISGQENQGRNSAIHRLWREVTAASTRPYAGMYTHASVSRVSMIE